MTINLNDKKENKLQTVTQALYAALKSDDEKVQEGALQDYSLALAENMKASLQTEVAKFENGRTDDAIMSKRANRIQLTSKEKKYFAEAVEKQTVAGLEETFPTTVMETIMEGLSQEHPIFSQIDTQYTEAAIKFIYSDPTKKTAYWDVIPADIRQILIGAFKKLDLTVSKLSGFIALPKGYFKLGPTWLAQYITTFLREVMTATLEEGVINGDGNLKPIGMMRKLSGAVDGVYPEKEVTKITALTPTALAGPRTLLAENKMLNGQISLVVNPITYESKISPNQFFQNSQTGSWTKVPLPNGESIVQSYAVPRDRAILGNLKNYLLAVAGDLSIDLYKETLAIEDMDLYIAKLFAAGVAKNPNAFIVLDLSDIQGATVPTAEGAANVIKQDTINPVKVETDPEV